MEFDRNLELILSKDGDVLAYRYDHPVEMINLVKDDGKWRFTDEAVELSKTDKLELKLLCRDFASN